MVTEIEAFIELVCKAASEEAIRQFRQCEEEAKRERHSKKLHNTRLILKNYRLLKIHNNSSITELSNIVDDDVFDVLSAMLNKPDAEEIKINSIKQSVARTRVILDHIETMLNAYKELCRSSCRNTDYRKWQVIERMYLNNAKITVDDIADELNVDNRTIYRDIDIACEELSSLLFGVDWL